MKLKLMMILVSALILTPVAVSYAADAGSAEKAKPKKKVKKGQMYNKFADAMKVAEANEEPVLVLMYIENDKRVKALEELFRWKQFAQDYAKSNLVLLKMKMKTTKDGKKVDLKTSFKTENEKRFVENHGINEKAAAQAKQKGDTLTAVDVSNYPAVVCVKGDAENQELLFRMDAYDRDGGPGVWLSSLHALLETKDIKPVVSKDVQKILDDPTAFAGNKKKR